MQFFKLYINFIKHGLKLIKSNMYNPLHVMPHIICRDPTKDDNGEETVSKWPVYTKESRDYKDLRAAIFNNPESIKSGFLRPKECALFEWYLSKVEGNAF